MNGKRKDDGWGGDWKNYMEAKQAKLDKQFTADSKKSHGLEKNVDIFTGVSIYVNGYTKPTASELRDIMTRHGGKYHVYYNPNLTTHIIATNLPNSKIATLKNEKVVRPEWMIDSIKAGCRLSEDPYLLYNTNRSLSQKCLEFPLNKSDELTTDSDSTGVIQNLTAMPSTSKINDQSANDRFIDDFYSKSRLHHISTMSLELKQFVKELQDNFDGSFPGRQRLEHWMTNPGKSSESSGLQKRTIMHIDMDCFFVSVGLRKFPHFRGKPVVVTHAKIPMAATGKQSMSDIACCSYEAREFGIKNGMLLGRALELCPNLLTIPYDFDDYKDVSRILYQNVASYTLEIEAVSCDELFVDCTLLLSDTSASREEFAECLRNDIKIATGCSCSVGMGSNFLLARLATKKAKPNGFYAISTEESDEFIKPQAVKDLPGVGFNMESMLKELNVISCADLQMVSLLTLKTHFGGKHGQTLYNQCRGIDHREIRKQTKRSSVSSEINYGIRFKDSVEAVSFLENLSKEIESRLKHANCKGKTITLKLKIRKPEAPLETAKFMGHGLCSSMSRSATLPIATEEASIIYRECCKLLKTIQVNVTDIRGVGIQMTRLIDILQAPHEKLDTLDRFMIMPHEINRITESPSKVTPLKKTSPTKGSPKRGSPRSVPYRFRTINEHFLGPSESLANLQISREERVAEQELPLPIEKHAEEPFNIKMSFNELIQKLKSWISTQEAPLEEDVKIVGNFLQTLISRCQMEKVQLILKKLERLVVEKNSTGWKDAHVQIQLVIQTEMKRFCGGSLKI